MIDELLKVAEIKGLQPAHIALGDNNAPRSQTIVCEQIKRR